MKAILNRIQKIINKGVTSQELSLSLAIGVTGGLWPVPMTSFVGCTILQVLFRVKPAFAVIIQACNFAGTNCHGSCDLLRAFSRHDARLLEEGP